MSTHVLGDVNLITKEEAQVMIETQLGRIDEFEGELASEKAERESADSVLQSNIEEEAAQRELTKTELEGKIADEQQLRESGDEALSAKLDSEAEDRRQADAALVAEVAVVKADVAAMREWENDDFPQASCARLSNLPIATITVSNSDKSLSVGDTIATVGARYLPAAPVNLLMLTEQEDQAVPGTFKTCLASLRLDANGNVNVVNLWEVTGATAATDEASVTYITKD